MNRKSAKIHKESDDEKRFASSSTTGRRSCRCTACLLQLRRARLRSPHGLFRLLVLQLAFLPCRGKLVVSVFFKLLKALLFSNTTGHLRLLGPCRGLQSHVRCGSSGKPLCCWSIRQRERSRASACACCLPFVLQRSQTQAYFSLPLSKDEPALQGSSGNRGSKVGHSFQPTN